MSDISLRVMVERPDKFKSGSFKVIFRQTLSFDVAVSIPFSDIYRGLRLLFPYDDAVVHFLV